MQLLFCDADIFKTKLFCCELICDHLTHMEDHIQYIFGESLERYSYPVSESFIYESTFEDCLIFIRYLSILRHHISFIGTIFCVEFLHSIDECIGHSSRIISQISVQSFMNSPFTERRILDFLSDNTDMGNTIVLSANCTAIILIAYGSYTLEIRESECEILDFFFETLI